MIKAVGSFWSGCPLRGAIWPADNKQGFKTLQCAGRADTSNITAACEVASAMESESILAALREANFERLERESAEAAAAAAHEAGEKLRVKLKASQKEVTSLKETIAAAAAEAKLRPSAEALQKALVRQLPDMSLGFSRLHEHGSTSYMPARSRLRVH